MKKLYYLLNSIAIVAVITIACEQASVEDANFEPLQSKTEKCTTIQSGELENSAGETIVVGFNDFGYNYQAHIYNGDYGYPGWNLVMKWSDSWLSNQDCDGDGLLDRHFGYDTYRGSGAWLTNHWTNTYIDGEGNVCEYDDFIKIIAAPLDATLLDGVWYNADGIEIGPVIWGQFAIIQSIINDPCEGIEGVDYNSPDNKGLGDW